MFIINWNELIPIGRIINPEKFDLIHIVTILFRIESKILESSMFFSSFLLFIITYFLITSTYLKILLLYIWINWNVMYLRSFNLTVSDSKLCLTVGFYEYWVIINLRWYVIQSRKSDFLFNYDGERFLLDLRSKTCKKLDKFDFLLSNFSFTFKLIWIGCIPFSVYLGRVKFDF